MIPLLIASLCPAPVLHAAMSGPQDPPPVRPEGVGQVAPHEPPDPRRLFSDWARKLQDTKVLHLAAEGILVTTDPQRPGVSVRWTFTSEAWLAKGGRVQARTRWTGPTPPPPSEAAPERFTSLVFADGRHLWQGFEGPEPLQRSELPSPRFVPHPLPEVFGLFDPVPGAPIPAAVVGETFDWGEPTPVMPTAIVLDPDEPGSEPAFWYGFTERGELAGWCTMMPERLGGDVLRGKFSRLQWLESLPEKDPPRFRPPGVEIPDHQEK